jgi:thiamine-phosphate pyrophosphorylase
MIGKAHSWAKLRKRQPSMSRRGDLIRQEESDAQALSLHMTPSPAAFPTQARLYGILDLGYVSPSGVEVVTRGLCEGGVDILQLRAKKQTPAEVESLARRMLAITRDYGVPLVINDHLEVAAAVGSEGVHVGQDDEAVAQARAVVGAQCFVGKSTHSLAQATAAQDEGADYIGFGPLYATGTKPDYVPIGLTEIAEAHRLVTIPVFCIGGVNSERLPEIVQAGARRVVVVSAFLQAPDVPEAVRRLKQALPPLQ